MSAAPTEKKTNGRKRQFWVDANGFLLRVLIHPANISDIEGAEWLLTDHRQSFPRLQEIHVDEAYKKGLNTRVEQNTSIQLNVIGKPRGQKGFAVIPKRWVVERSIVWARRNRLASKEYNRNATPSESLYLSRFNCNALESTLSEEIVSDHALRGMYTYVFACGTILHVFKISIPGYLIFLDS